MAIVKMINYKQSGMREMAHNIAYGCNPAKKGSIKKDIVYGIASSPEKSFVVNKWLNGKLECKRLFKSGVVSMETTWSNRIEEFCEYEKRMYQLAEYIASWWWDEGFQTVCSVHCNTKHPHIHFFITAREKLVKTIQSGDVDYKDIREIIEYNENVDNYNVEQLSARILFDLTRNTGFEVSKGSVGGCWINSCCEWEERMSDDICGLDVSRLPLKEKMKRICESTSLLKRFRDIGLEVAL